MGRFAELRDRGFLEEMQLKHSDNLVGGIMGEYPSGRGPSRALVLLRLKQAGISAKQKHKFPQLWEGSWLADRLAERRTFKGIAELIPGCSSGAVFYAVRVRGLKPTRGELKRDQPQVNVRVPREVYDKLKGVAERAKKPITKVAERLLTGKILEINGASEE